MEIKLKKLFNYPRWYVLPWGVRRVIDTILGILAVGTGIVLIAVTIAFGAIAIGKKIDKVKVARVAIAKVEAERIDARVTAFIEKKYPETKEAGDGDN